VEVAGGVQMHVPANPNATVGQDVVLGIRPEHFELGTPENGVEGRVKIVEPTGANIQVYGQIGATEICAIFLERHDFRPEQEFWLSYPGDKVHLFDAASGARR
ncbi:MAG TPA: TOBE domain-containing protein, partial [Paracoccaceae bacterium]|nr:TOBE domain-containing protein [Paracoccaceae bacterium]